MTLERMRAALYALLAIAGAALGVAVLTLVRQGVPAGTATLLAVPPALLFAAIGMASRYVCRALPLETHSFARILTTHGGSAIAASGLWVLAWQQWLTWLGRGVLDVSLLLGPGALLYAAMIAVHYLLLQVESARRAQEAALRYELLAREAELKAFKAQIDPHFLFNSLNAVAALCGSSPRDAREMTQLLADFFRQTLRLGALDRIALAQELELLARYVAIEQVRFRERLTLRINADDAARAVEVPPLLLQPLIENAVRHGVASMVEGGTVLIDAAVVDRKLRIVIENPADPDRAQSRGEGIGLQNARGRLAAISAGRASLRTTEAGGMFRVEIEVPQ